MDKRNAGFGIRLIACLIDGSLVWLPITLAVFLIGTTISTISSLLSGIIILITLMLLQRIIEWLYYAFMTSSYGATLGKMVCGLRVEMVDGSRMDFSKSLFRHTLGYLTSAALFGIGFLAIIKDPENRGWHDKVSDTAVVYRGKDGNIPAGLFALIMLLIVNTYLMYLGVNSVINSSSIRSDWMMYEERMRIPSEEDLMEETDDPFPAEMEMIEV